MGGGQMTTSLQKITPVTKAPRIDPLRGDRKSNTVNTTPFEPNFETDPNCIAKFEERNIAKKDTLLAIPPFSREQAPIPTTARNIYNSFEALNDLSRRSEKEFENTIKLNQALTEQRLQKLRESKQELEACQEQEKKNKFVSSILSAVGFCAAFTAGATLAASGNIYSGGALMLGALTSAIDQTTRVNESKYAPALQTLGIVLSLASLGAGGITSQQKKLIQGITSIKSMLDAGLGIHKGKHKIKRYNQEKKLFLLSQNSKVQGRVFKETLYNIKTITEQTYQSIQEVAEMLTEYLNMSISVSKRG